jgi:hypothetical protein
MNEYEIFFRGRAFASYAEATNPRAAVAQVQGNRATAGLPELTVERVVQTVQLDPEEWV